MGRAGIIAAGAVMLGVGTNQGKILLIRRKRYGDEVSLPKGKLQDGEDEVVAATREVLEETGCEGRMTGYAGSTHYQANGVPKVVFYMNMQAANDDVSRPRDTEEVCAVEWLSISDAIVALSHREERELVASVFGTSGKP